MVTKKYISKEAEVGLNNYKYHGCDGSLFSGLMQPYWNWCVEYLPKWMAPNLVTFTGFVFIGLASFLVYWDHWGLNYNNVHGWVWLFLSFCVFFYQTMDSIDGKQARRTGSSSPLGELFDHGCDAIVTIWMSTNFLCCIRLTGLWAFAFMLATTITSYAFIWEQFHTNELRFGYLNSPTEALLINIALFFATGISQEWTHMWDYEFHGLHLNQWFVLFGLIVSVSTLIPSAINVFKATSDQTRRNHPLLSFLPVIVEGLGMSAFVWAAPQVMIEAPLVTVLTFGLLSAYSQTRMIVSRVCDEKVVVFQFIMLPLPFMALSQMYYPLIDPVYMLYAFLLFVVGFYFHFVYYTVQEICMHCGIYCFTLRKRPKNE